jgi:pimeloyl-ACP methyl ester carboxylesterase
MSMGGYIVQLVAINHPTRVASLALMSTSASSDPEFLVSIPGDGTAVTTPPELLDRDAYVAMFVGGQRHYQSPGFPFDAEQSANLGGRYYDRVYQPAGLVRQWNALLRGPLERRSLLEKVTVPVVIIHGRQDQSLLPHAALTMAELLPHAEVHIYAEMGHDIPEELWPEFVLAFARTAGRSSDA